ncbi:YncE family protein [Bacillus dakarensis]|uniref:YncE family protein n=1 Tax=Robertmurraya dakarensis TaxID=1926278 RepID=UPI0009825D7C|nr:hypothetical protein [Bacillus dakarensis]
MKWFIKLMMVVLILVLTSCSDDQYPSISEDQNVLITVNIKDMSVSFINVDTKEKIAEWQMEKPYTGGLILPDRDTLLLYGKQLDNVDLFSLRNGEKVSSWELGKGIVNGKLLKGGNQIAFADQSLHAVRFYNTIGQELEVVKTEANPLTLFENQETEKLYVISFNAENLTVIDENSTKKITSFPIHPSAAGAVLRENQREIWIGGHGEGTELESNIHVYDTVTGELLKQIPAPLMPINFQEKDGFIYVLSHGSNTLYKLDSEGKVADSTKVGANPFEMTVLGESLIIAGYDSDDIHFINADTLEITKTVSVGRGPFQLILRGE